MKYFQIAGDALIPILGYYFWDWNLYFILLFYIADLIVGELFIWLRSEKIRKYNRLNPWASIGMYSLISFSALCVTVLLINNGIIFLHPEMNLWEELNKFWNQTELGIPQGYLLIPLLILMGYQQFQLVFMVPGMYKIFSMKQLWKEHATRRALLLAFTALSCTTVYFLPLPDQLLLWFIVIGIAMYSLLSANQHN